MAELTPLENTEFAKKKGFWSRPEGVTGAIFLAAILGGIGYAIYALPWAVILANTLYLILTVAAIAAVGYMILDPKMRNLIWYMYKSVMRSITGMFVKIDPIGILKSYVDDLKDNLRKMSKQIGAIKGQMRKIETLMKENEREIEKNMQLASAAQRKGVEKQVLLSTRKAARLKDTNAKYASLYSKMEVLSRILTKMYQNSEILLEDTADQVRLKEQERKAIRASHSAMKSAMTVISGDPDKRAMFDMALENIADDVANKVGEMERFMELSSSFMESVDLQNGIFEEQGLKMLEEYEKKSTILLLGDKTTTSSPSLDLNSTPRRAERQTRSSQSGNSYDNLFE